MSDYVLLYYGGQQPESPEEGAEQMERWRAWLSGLGNAVVNPGVPLGTTKTVSSQGVSDNRGTNPLTGFSIVRADSINPAVEMAKACPFLEMGTIDVAEAHEMQ